MWEAQSDTNLRNLVGGSLENMDFYLTLPMLA
jgi:hypothetical protein